MKASQRGTQPTFGREISAAALALGMLLLGLCQAVQAQQALASQDNSPTLAKLRNTGLVVLGHRLSSAPFSYLDGRRQPVGYSIDLCQRVVDHLRSLPGLNQLEVKWVAVTSATRLPLMANRSLDLECGVTTNTLERQRSQAFSVTTFVAASRILSRKQEPYRSLEDLRGQPVASTLATTSIQFLHAANLAQQLDMRILAGQDDTDAFRMLRNGRAVAFVMDDVLLRGVLANAADARDYEISEEALTVEPYGLGLPAQDPVFKQVVDEVLVQLFRQGDIQAIYRKWFQQPIPPRGLNLNWPMSAPLQRVIAKPTDSPDPAAYR